MKVELKIEGQQVIVTDEHTPGVSGLPVAVVDGKAFGLGEYLPIDFITCEFGAPFDTAGTIISAAAAASDLTISEKAFIYKTCNHAHYRDPHDPFEAENICAEYDCFHPSEHAASA